MSVPTVTLDELVEPEWGNAVAAAIAALESADSAIQSALGVITANGWVTSARIGTGQVTEAKLASNSVTAAKIAAGAVNTSELASGSVTTAKIADGDVTNAKLASGIDASKLTTGTLPAARIGSNAITTARIQDGAVTNAKIAALSVHQPFANIPFFFYRIGGLVLFHADNITSNAAGSGTIPAAYRPTSNQTIIMHRTSDGAHRDISITAGGSYSIVGTEGPWTAFHGWRAAS